eukprot:CAMPEP_0202913874 /NCGR_PEP_ID=MMETSP1392-20130828/61677_1 /ASSEMBLY_ACC=CAM_ASM_000868 /TAXON_ID=225041 /ORGANISM="Chlamydomonas chlamydogama, Strain SAG 11-48b" /LENGTH=777 /DNA_ID=CAMNT_0049605309 /DNA_START=18 /DNA_END=2351 /DNA_ORIENTATION=-
MAGDIFAELQQALPPDLDQQGHNVAIIQEAIDKLDNFQTEARMRMFKLLTHKAYSQDIQQLDGALAELCASAYLLPGTLEAQLAEHAQQFRVLNAQVAQLTTQVAEEQATADVHAQATELEKHIQQGHYTECAWSVVRMRKTLQEAELGASDQVEARLSLQKLHLLEANTRSSEAQLRKVLDGAVREAVQVDAAQHTLLLRPVVAGCAPVREVWGALEALGELQERLQAVADLLLSQVVEPVLSGGLVTSVQAAPPGSQEPTRLHWAAAGPGATHNPEQSCQQVLKLVAEQLLGLDDNLLRQWGEVFWRRLCDVYIRLHAHPFVRAHPDDMDACGSKADAARGLEEFAESLGLVDEPYLGPAVEALGQQVLCAHQQRYLDQARSLLVSTSPQDLEPVQVGRPISLDEEHYRSWLSGALQEWQREEAPCGCSGEGPVLGAGQYQSSARMRAVVELVQGALADASSCGNPTTATALVGAVSKIALMVRMFQAGDQLLQAPQLAFLYHNDLRHLADAILLLWPCYGPELAPLLQQGSGADASWSAGQSAEQVPSGFLQDALLLRETARRVMQQQLEQQHAAMHELLSGLGNLRHLGPGGNAQAGITYRKTVRQLLHSLGRLGRAAVEVLPPEHAVHVCTSVLGSICGSLCADILAKRDIGIDDSRDLRDILQPLVDEALPTMLGAQPPAAPGKAQQQQLSGIPLAVVLEAATAACTPLRKLRTLLSLLEAGMKEIVGRWQQRALQADGLDQEDVEHMLCALFQDSQYRREALARVRETAH